MRLRLQIITMSMACMAQKKIKNEANTNYNLLSATNSKPTFIKLEDAKGTHIK